MKFDFLEIKFLYIQHIMLYVLWKAYKESTVFVILVSLTRYSIEAKFSETVDHWH